MSAAGLDWEVYNGPEVRVMRAELFRGRVHLVTVRSRWTPALLVKMIIAQLVNR